MASIHVLFPMTQSLAGTWQRREITTNSMLSVNFRQCFFHNTGMHLTHDVEQHGEHKQEVGCARLSPMEVSKLAWRGHGNATRWALTNESKQNVRSARALAQHPSAIDCLSMQMRCT